jgi:hypothetical protein
MVGWISAQVDNREQSQTTVEAIQEVLAAGVVDELPPAGQRSDDWRL